MIILDLNWDEINKTLPHREPLSQQQLHSTANSPGIIFQPVFECWVAKDGNESARATHAGSMQRLQGSIAQKLNWTRWTKHMLSTILFGYNTPPDWMKSAASKVLLSVNCSTSVDAVAYQASIQRRWKSEFVPKTRFDPAFSPDIPKITEVDTQQGNQQKHKMKQATPKWHWVEMCPDQCAHSDTFSVLAGRGRSSSNALLEGGEAAAGMETQQPIVSMIPISERFTIHIWPCSWRFRHLCDRHTIGKTSDAWTPYHKQILEELYNARTIHKLVRFLHNSGRLVQPLSATAQAFLGIKCVARKCAAELLCGCALRVASALLTHKSPPLPPPHILRNIHPRIISFPISSARCWCGQLGRFTGRRADHTSGSHV